MIVVKILDSSPIFIRGLADVLSGQDMNLVEAKIGSTESTERPPDVALVDPAVFPRFDPETIEYLSVASQVCPVLVLTADSHPDLSDAYLGAGAAAVISKREEPEALVAAIRTAIRGIEGLAEDAASLGGEGPALSERERQVLGHIAGGLTHGQVARRLGISRHTVDTYVKRVRFKLGVGNKAELTRVAILGNYSGDAAASRA